ncbi:baseplate assembly protein [Salmonella enterica subsp. salamae]|nr:baseplate assembly protein [Salmonella enterica subsp. salamae]ECJ2281384.1 baseplate assembly protein [Salmonella enterica subsp. salamae]
MPKFKDQVSRRLMELQGLDPDFNALVESDPAVKLLEILVYREMINVSRFNSGILAVLLAYAKGADLDQLGANFDVPRRTITPEDDTTIPPTPAVMEDDDSYRHLIRLHWYAINTAGSIYAYEYLALSNDGTVADAKAYGPQESADINPGCVEVYLLNSDGSGAATDEQVNSAATFLSGDYVRPLTDYVTVKSADIVNYDVAATLVIGTGPDADTVIDAARKAVQRYADSVHKIGALMSRSGIIRACKQPGVEDVVLDSPPENIVMGKGQASYCNSITLTPEDSQT